MFTSLPMDACPFIEWDWSKIEPYLHDLHSRPLTQSNIHAWLADWTHLSQLLYETYQRLYVATTVNTADTQASQRYQSFVNDIYPQAQAAEQKLKEKLLSSGLEPQGFEIPLRNLRAEADLFRPENLPLLSDELNLWIEYDRIIGAQTVSWDGREIPVLQLQPWYRHAEREIRQRAWTLGAQRQLADREAMNALWVKYLHTRQKIATNAGRANYRAYRWQQLLRFDYTPRDCRRFHRAIEEVVVPVVQRFNERRRRLLGVATLRPWDLHVDPRGRPPIQPYQEVDELEANVAAVFHRVDHQLGRYFETMRREGLLDLENRKNKAPGGYCTDFPVARRPFIFMNAVGLHDDVQTLLHEGGHAFHVFESAHLPYLQQRNVPMEFAEVASMAMELLASPYLAYDQGGFYTSSDAARARAEHLEDNLRFWPYMAVVDAFQHWAYENPSAAADPHACDAQWSELWQRFMPGVDWSGLEEIVATGWQRKPHIFQSPFYYIEYGLAQLGATQIWRNALSDPASAVAAYRRALSLGGTVSLPQLYAAAGAAFAFDAKTLRRSVELIEQTILALENQ